MLEDIEQIEARISVLVKLAKRLAADREEMQIALDDRNQKITQLEKENEQQKTELAANATRLQSYDADLQKATQENEQQNKELKSQLETLQASLTEAQREVMELRDRTETYKEGLVHVRGRVNHVLNNLPAKQS